MEVDSKFVVQFWLLYIFLFYLRFSWEVIFYFFKVTRNELWKHVPVVKSTFLHFSGGESFSSLGPLDSNQ